MSSATLVSAARPYDGSPWTGHINFTNFSGNASATAADFSVEIEWGDGNTSAATMTTIVPHRLFRATATHTYTAAGVPPLSSGSDAQNQILASYLGQTSQQIGAVSVNVVDRPIVPIPLAKRVQVGADGTISAVIGSFRDANPLITAEDFDATVETAGADVTASVNSVGNGVFSVSVVGAVPTTARSLLTEVSDVGGAKAQLHTLLAVQKFSIAAAYAKAQPGDVIVIPAGTYVESLDLTISGTADAPITLEAKKPGSVILNGGGVLNTAISGTAQYITLSGLTIENYESTGYQNQEAAVMTNTGWSLNDVTVQRCSGTGIGVFGDDVTLTDVVAQNNGVNGIGGSGASDVTLTDCTSSGNNTGALFPAHDPTDEGGGGKWTQCDGLTFINYHGDNNCGPGLWLDFENQNVTLVNCEASGNHGGGPFAGPTWIGAPVAIEANFGPVMVTNFDAAASNSGALGIWESAGVDVTQSTLLSGVNFRTLDRGVAGLVDNEDAVTDSNVAALTLTGNPPTNLTLSGNTYQVAPGPPFT